MQENKCGPGQPPEPHRSWISRLAFPPLGAARRWYWSDSARKECHFYQYWLQKRDSENHFSATPAVAGCPARSRADCGGDRNARATGTRSRAFPNFPWQFTLENCPVCHRRHRNHPLARFENCHVFAEPTLFRNVAASNRKTFPACAEPVDDEISLWKAEENGGGNRENETNSVARESDLKGRGFELRRKACQSIQLRLQPPSDC